MGAQFWLAKCGRSPFWIDSIGVGYTVLRVRGHDQVRCIGGGAGLSQNSKNLVSKMWEGLVFGRGNPIGVGYAGVKVVRGHATHLFTVAPPPPPLTSPNPC